LFSAELAIQVNMTPDERPDKGIDLTRALRDQVDVEPAMPMRRQRLDI
jgi:hypothetical protein